MRVERIGLKHHGDVALLGRDPIDHPRADADFARRDLLQPGDHAQQCRFAASGGADQYGERSVRDLDGNPVQDARLPKRLYDVFNRQRRHSNVPGG
jgi:hypothetical protein